MNDANIEDIDQSGVPLPELDVEIPNVGGLNAFDSDS